LPAQWSLWRRARRCKRTQNRGPALALINSEHHNDHNNIWQDDAVIVDTLPSELAAYFLVFTQQLAPTDKLGNPGAAATQRRLRITQIDIQSLYAQMFECGLSARTIEYTNAVLQSVFRQAVRWKMLAEDPCNGVDLPRMERKEMEALSVEECRRFLEIAEKSEWYPVLALALTTGMRPSEYLALKWSDTDWHRGTASVCRTIQVSGVQWAFDDTKRKSSRRIVKLQNFVLRALHELREKQGSKREGNCSAAHELIFISGAGLPLKQRAVKREFRRLLAIAGIRSIRLYDLRHTAATLGIAAGVSVKVISDQLGHASISFTLERYSHVLPSIQDEAAAKVERLLVA
jgi:integrase